jgi:SAM-dependent methyltransferase
MIFNTKIKNNPISTFVIESNHNLYRRALKREMGIWKNSNSDQNFLEEEFHKTEFSYLNNSHVFKCNKDWLDFLTLFGPFPKALVLGGNETGLEEYLLKNDIVENIENLDIIHKGINSINQFADLNFVELKESTYDLVIAKSILHHIVNLEHLIIQVNRSLKENGLFIVFEYIGENKQQWDQNKIDVVNSEFSCEDILPGYKFNRLAHNYYNDWPFESIRSQEIVKVLHSVFNNNIVKIEWGKLNWPLDYHISQYCHKNQISLDSREKEILKNRANLLDDLHKDDKSIISSYLFGIYKKCLVPYNLEIKKWQKSKIRKEFLLRGPISYRIKSLLSTYRNTKIVRTLMNLNKLLKKIK